MKIVSPSPPEGRGGILGAILLIFHDGYDTHACVPKRHFGVQARTMKNYRIADTDTDTDTLFSK